jgi:hypothetical protein
MLSPLELMGHAMIQVNGSSKIDQQRHRHQWTVHEFDPAPGRRDRILVLPLDPHQRTGIITYVKQMDALVDDDDANNYSQAHDDASQSRSRSRYVAHTLNAPSGFQRKLHAVGIQLSKK